MKCNICSGTGWCNKAITSNSLTQTGIAEVCWMCGGSGSKPKKFLKRAVKYLLHYSLLIIFTGAILIALGYRLFLK